MLVVTWLCFAPSHSCLVHCLTLCLVWVSYLRSAPGAGHQVLIQAALRMRVMQVAGGVAQSAGGQQRTGGLVSAAPLKFLIPPRCLTNQIQIIGSC
jgi:hypothetical protein